MEKIGKTPPSPDFHLGILADISALIALMRSWYTGPKLALDERLQPDAVKPDTPLPGLALGWPAAPEHLFVDAEGKPVRIDKGFSWEFPLSVHGLMHNAITNAWRGDPYRIDTLLIFMANMAWNSTMNTSEVRRMLNDRDTDGPTRGEYKIPFIIVCDAFQSEMTAFADLVLPDTTYLERHDVMSMLDRPISEFDGPVDAVRIPVLPPRIKRLDNFKRMIKHIIPMGDKE